MLWKVQKAKDRLIKNFANARRRRRIKRHKAERCEKQLKDWIIPLKYNFWFQLGTLFLFTAFLQVGCGFLYRHFTVDSVAITILLFVAGGGILGMTEFGQGTVRSYRRVRHVLDQKIGEIKFDVRLQEKIARELYCYRVGARVAAAERELSKQLIPALANKWTPF